MQKYIEKECSNHGITTFRKVKNGNLGYRYRCIKCDSYWNKECQRKRKRRCVEYKGGKCEKCGYNKCMAALDFHHIDPSEKEFSFSKKRVKWETLKAELDKCILVCANCHREIHAEES